MDAIEYLEAKTRMTKANRDPKGYDSCGISCNECPLGDDNNGKNLPCTKLETVYPEEAVSIVKNYILRNPVKTRQSEFLKMFPNAKIDKFSGAIDICPTKIDAAYAGDPCRSMTSCKKCHKRYWLEEIDDEK